MLDDTRRRECVCVCVPGKVYWTKLFAPVLLQYLDTALQYLRAIVTSKLLCVVENMARLNGDNWRERHNSLCVLYCGKIQ